MANWRLREQRLPLRRLFLLATLVAHSSATTVQRTFYSLENVDMIAVSDSASTLTPSENAIDQRRSSGKPNERHNKYRAITASASIEAELEKETSDGESHLDPHGEVIDDGESDDEFVYVVLNRAHGSTEKPETEYPVPSIKTTSYFWTTNSSHIFPIFQAASVSVPYSEVCKDWLQGPKAQMLGLVCLFLSMAMVFEGMSFLFWGWRHRCTGNVILDGRERQLKAYSKDMEAGLGGVTA